LVCADVLAELRITQHITAHKRKHTKIKDDDDKRDEDKNRSKLVINIINSSEIVTLKYV
jgi:hypothetical protein